MPTTVLPDSRVIETKIYNFFVDGKPTLHPDLARIFDGIDGVEISGGSAPREFWRAILGDEAPSVGWSAPVAEETETEYQIRLERARKAHDGAVIVSVEDFDAALAGTELPVEDKPTFDETAWVAANPPRSAEAGGWWFSPPRAPSEALRAVLALDLEGFADAADQFVLEACRAGRTTEIPGEIGSLVAERIARAYFPSTPICSLKIEHARIDLVPLPTVGRGKVRIPREKLDKLSVGVSTENPRLARIQAASKLARLEDLLVEARRGSGHPKEDGDRPDGADKITIRCPTVGHADTTPSAWVGQCPDGLGWGCSGCRGGASSLPGLIRAYHPRVSWDEACGRAEAILGLTEWGRVENPISPSEAVELLGAVGMVSVETAQTAPEAPQTAPEAVVAPEAVQTIQTAPEAVQTAPVENGPPWAEVYKSFPPPSDLAGAWLASRGLDPARIKTFLRGGPPSAAPWQGGAMDARYLLAWAAWAQAKGWALFLPTFDHTGKMVGIRARGCTDGAAKTRTPSLRVGATTHRAGQAGVLANPAGLRVLRGESVGGWIVISEGEPDFLTACQTYPDAAVFGVYRGKDVWTVEIAARIPDGSKVALLTDPDAAGRGYRRTVIRSLGNRVRFFDAAGRTKDLNDLHVSTGVPALDDLKPVPVGVGRELTDLGNAERLLDAHGGELAYSAEAGRWYILDGGVWVEQPKEPLAVVARMQAIARGIEVEAEEASSEEGAKAIAAWGRKSQDASRVSAALTSAKPMFAVGDVFDKHQFLLGVANGVLDLATGELLEDPGPAYVSRRCSVEWNPDATAPRWEKFLDEIMLGDKEMISYLRRCVGYWVTGSCREQKFWVLHGARGGNGKGTLLGALQKLLGGMAASQGETLLCRREGQQRWDLGALEGKRLVVVNEAPRGGRLTVETAKNIVSEDEIAGERKHRDPKSFAPTHKIVWALNDLPEIPSDPAIFRRLRLIPFDFQPSVPDEHLASTLEAELPGILAWAARGCREWLAGGLRCPEKVMARVKALEEEADTVGEWVRECCELGPSFFAPRAALHEAFSEWAGRAGKPALSARLFFADLEKKGFVQRLSGGAKSRTRSFIGIKIRSDPDSPFGGIGSGAGTGSTPKTGGGIDLSDLDEILKLN